MGFYLWGDASRLSPEPIDLDLGVLLGSLLRHRRLAHARTCATQTAIMKKRRKTKRPFANGVLRTGVARDAVGHAPQRQQRNPHLQETTTKLAILFAVAILLFTVVRTTSRPCSFTILRMIGRPCSTAGGGQVTGVR